jgi:hypothetical protein
MILSLKKSELISTNLQKLDELNGESHKLTVEEKLNGVSLAVKINEKIIESEPGEISPTIHQGDLNSSPVSPSFAKKVSLFAI